MSISHRTNRLKLVGSPSVEKLQNGRYKLVVTCSTMNSREDWYSANKDRIFPDFGSLQSAEMSIDGLAPRTGEAYADMRLTQVESGNRSGMGQVGDYNVSLTYETLGSSFVQVKDDNTDYELNGLRRVTRTSIAEAGTDYDKTVGTSHIDHQIDAETAVRCYLGSYGIDDTDSFRQVQEVYIEAGVLSRSTQTKSNGKLIIETVEALVETPVAETAGAVQIGNDISNVQGIQTKRFTFAKGEGQISVDRKPASTQLAGCTYVTVRSIGTPVTPTGVIISEYEIESDGFITYEKTALQGTITGVKQTYTDVADVEVPGEVECTTEDISISDGIIGNITGTIAVPKVQPRRSKKIAATVTVEITSSPPSTASLAYDLGQISCSVTSISKNYTSRNGPTNYTHVGFFTTAYTDWQRSYTPSARIQVYPGCFLTSASSTGSVAYKSQKTYVFEPDENGDGYYDGLESTIESNASSSTSCIGQGSTSNTGYTTTGILKRDSRPILTDLDGTTYYEVITWSV